MAQAAAQRGGLTFQPPISKKNNVTTQPMNSNWVVFAFRAFSPPRLPLVVPQVQTWAFFLPGWATMQEGGVAGSSVVVRAPKTSGRGMARCSGVRMSSPLFTISAMT